VVVVALANIRCGLVSYVPGEIIDGLTEQEVRRLIELGYAAAVMDRYSDG
jgi:hypothetical protein